MPKPVIVSIHGLTRYFGDVRTVAGVDLDIFEGEFLTLLGPSGSGKTTVLRMIAGFEKPDAGTILLSGKDVSQLPPYDRDVNGKLFKESFGMASALFAGGLLAFGLSFDEIVVPIYLSQRLSQDTTSGGRF